MHDGAVGDRGMLTDFHQASRLGVDCHAVLNVRMGADDDRLHALFVVDLVGPNYCLRADEHVFLNDRLAADHGGLIEIGGLMDDRQVAIRVFPDHANFLQQGIRMDAVGIICFY